MNAVIDRLTISTQICGPTREHTHIHMHTQIEEDRGNVPVDNYFSHFQSFHTSLSLSLSLECSHKQISVPVC